MTSAVARGAFVGRLVSLTASKAVVKLFSKVKKDVDVVPAVKAFTETERHRTNKNKLRRSRLILVMFVVCFMD